MLAPVIGAAANATLIDCDELAPADLTLPRGSRGSSADRRRVDRSRGGSPGGWSPTDRRFVACNEMPGTGREPVPGQDKEGGSECLLHVSQASWFLES
jgi:hypothetical protein